jgi:hypothetical protein
VGVGLSARERGRPRLVEHAGFRWSQDAGPPRAAAAAAPRPARIHRLGSAPHPSRRAGVRRTLRAVPESQDSRGARTCVRYGARTDRRAGAADGGSTTCPHSNTPRRKCSCSLRTRGSLGRVGRSDTGGAARRAETAGPALQFEGPLGKHEEEPIDIS